MTECCPYPAVLIGCVSSRRSLSYRLGVDMYARYLAVRAAIGECETRLSEAVKRE